MRVHPLLPFAVVVLGLLPAVGRSGRPEPIPAIPSRDEDGWPKPAPDALRIHVVDVGQGDCTVIEGPKNDRGDRKVLVIDVGETAQQGNESKHKVLPYLRKMLDDGPANRPVVQIDYLIPTHYHKDHMGAPSGEEGSGIFWLWEALDVKVGKLLDTGLDYDAGGMGDRNYRQWVEQRGVPRETLRFDQLGPNKQIDMGEGVWIEVLAVGAVVEGRGRVVPDKWVATTSQNDFSIAVVVHYGRFDMFTAGDLSGYLHESWGAWYHSIEAAMFPHLRPLEVYRVNHHGSQWSSCYGFMQRIQPEVSLISCGQGHKHPNQYTVQRLLGYEDYNTGRPLGSDIYQTRNDDGFVLDHLHPHTLKAQRVANGPILVETDGVTNYRVVMPGLQPVEYAFDPQEAYTDVPWTVKQARSREKGRADTDWNEVYDREDTESVTTPRGDDPDGGGD